MKTLLAILSGVAVGTLAALWMAPRQVVEPGGIAVASGGASPGAVAGTSEGAADDE